jgi:Mn2+/Fe2+ NRAMP family transporter
LFSRHKREGIERGMIEEADPPDEASRNISKPFFVSQGMGEVPLQPKVRERQSFGTKSFFEKLGPGLITGASDDDPSGIGTYSQAGAQLGFDVGWTMLLTYPLMAGIQEIAARVGRVTGHGIAGNVCRHLPTPFLWPMLIMLFAANTVNIAADLGAMGDAVNLVFGGSRALYVVLFGLVSVVAQIQSGLRSEPASKN